jgi:tetratricopeptide (TPR) repeat protein
VQLSEVVGERAVWSDRYDRELADVFAVQDEITQEVVGALGAQLVRRRPAREFASQEAYEAYLLGRHHIHRFNIPQAVAWFKVATDLDPDNADAWAQLARINALLTDASIVPNSGENLRERTEYIARALASNPEHPLAIALKAMDVFLMDRDYQASINQLFKVVQANPNHPEAHLFLALGLQAIDEWQSANRAMKRFWELDQSPNAELSVARQYVQMGLVQDAHRALTAYRETWIPAEGMALAATEAELAFADRDPARMQIALDSGLLNNSPMLPIWTALVSHLKGDHAAAAERLKPLAASTQYVPHFAQSYGAIIEGRLEEAVDHWRAGVLAGEGTAVYQMIGDYSWRTTFPEYYEHPDYQRMLVEFGLDAQSLSEITVPKLPF